MLLDQFVSKMQLSARGQICSCRSEIIQPVEVDGPFDLPPGHDGPGLPDTLAVLDDGLLALSGGRPGLYLWLDREGQGRNWQRVDIRAHHNACRPDEPITESTDLHRQVTTAYTEVISLAENQLLYIYDRIPHGWEPIPEGSTETNSVWVVRATVDRV